MFLFTYIRVINYDLFTLTSALSISSKKKKEKKKLDCPPLNIGISLLRLLFSYLLSSLIGFGYFVGTRRFGKSLWEMIHNGGNKTDGECLVFMYKLVLNLETKFQLVLHYYLFRYSLMSALILICHKLST